jgi:large subunit ribosomal protein L25
MLKSEVVVAAVKRDESIRTKDLRASGFIPAVIYGQGKEAMSIQIEYQPFRKAFRETGTSTLLDIDIDGKKIPTLVHDIQYHPVSGEYLHLDLYQVQEGVPVTTHVEVIVEGLAPAVKNKAAVLVTPVKMLEIRCLPRNLFHDVRIDVSGLKEYHDTIKVSDLPLAQDENIEILTDMDTALATANPPKGGSKDDEESAEGEAAEGEAATAEAK